MTLAEGVSVLTAGMAAGTLNAVVGSGTLVTFPVLLAVGFPPVTANVTNALGLVPGSLAGAIGYRGELRGQEARAVRLGLASSAGAFVGAVVLLTLPATAFEAVVPVLIALAVLSILFQPWLGRRLLALRPPGHEPGRGFSLAIVGTGIYGGYFGAGQGILLLGLMGAALPDDLQRLNALKNVLAGAVNLVAGAVFALAAHVAWSAALLVAIGALAGGVLGARYGRRLSPPALRAVVAVVGMCAIVRLMTG
jgi:uncharacterized membrane protein YfcA